MTKGSQNAVKNDQILNAGFNKRGDVSGNKLNISVTSNKGDIDVCIPERVVLFDINGSNEKFLNVTGKKKLEELLHC